MEKEKYEIELRWIKELREYVQKTREIHGSHTTPNSLQESLLL